MTLFLVIYLLGFIATAVSLFCSLEKGYRVTLGDLIAGVLICLLSWMGFIGVMMIWFSDYVVFTKK